MVWRKETKTKKNLTDFILRNIKFRNNRHTADYIIGTVDCGLIIAQSPFIKKRPINRSISIYVATNKVLHACHTWSYRTIISERSLILSQTHHWKSIMGWMLPHNLHKIFGHQSLIVKYPFPWTGSWSNRTSSLMSFHSKFHSIKPRFNISIFLQVFHSM